MEKRRTIKKPIKPRLPYKPVKAVMAKRVLFEEAHNWNRNKPFKLDLKISELMEQLPSDVDIDNLHLLIENESVEKGEQTFLITFYAPEAVRNPNYTSEKRQFEQDMKEYETSFQKFKGEKNKRRLEIRDIIENETKPKRSEVEDEDGPIKIKVKNRDVK